VELKHFKSQLAVLALFPCASQAQQPTVPPVPSQFATAHNIFLASGSAPGYSDEKMIATSIYNSTYQALASLPRYHLVSTPADSELSMVITLRPSPGGEGFLNLKIFDTKTHTLIWVLDEPIKIATLEKTFVKNAQASAQLFLEDLNTLASGRLPGDVSPPSPTKARFSQEGK
jgi:hypothetical protein